MGFRVERAEGRVGRGGGRGCSLELLFGEQRVAGFELLVGGGVEAVRGLAASGDGLARNERVSGECHDGSSY
jgi:hypothetical protein